MHVRRNLLQEKAAADARLKGAAAPAKTAVKPLKAKLVIPSGTKLSVALIDLLDTDKNSAGDHFLASLAESVVIDGNTVLEKGTKVRGYVIEVQDSGRVKGLASIRLALTDIMQGTRMVAITTETFAATADSSQTRDAEIIAGGAGVGAVIGAIAGGKKGAAVGAIAGGGAGTGVVLGAKDKEGARASTRAAYANYANNAHLCTIAQRFSGIFPTIRT